MSLRLLILWALVFSTSFTLVGCSSGSGLFRKPFGRSEQWEPEIDEEETASSTKKPDWKTEAGNTRRTSGRLEDEDPLDKLIWSDEAREINRNLGVR